MDNDESTDTDELSVSQSVQDVESGQFQGTHPRGFKDDPFYAIKQDLLINLSM